MALSQRFARGRDRHLDIGITMGQRYKHRLELRRRDIDPALDHAMEVACKRLRIGVARAFSVAHVIDPYEERQNRNHPIDASATSCRRERLAQPRREPRAYCLEAFVSARTL